MSQNRANVVVRNIPRSSLSSTSSQASSGTSPLLQMEGPPQQESTPPSMMMEPTIISYPDYSQESPHHMDTIYQVQLLHQRLMMKEKEVHQLQKEVTTKNSVIQSFNSKINYIEKENKKLYDEKRFQSALHLEKCSEFDRIMAENTELKRRHNDAATKWKTLEFTNYRVSQDNQQLAEANLACTAQIQQLVENVQHLDHSRNELQSQLGGAEERIRQLETSLSIKEKEGVRFQKESQQFKAAYRESSTKVEELLQENNKLKESNSVLEKEVATLKERLEQAGKRVKDKVEQLSKAAGASQERIGKLEEEIKKLRTPPTLHKSQQHPDVENVDLNGLSYQNWLLSKNKSKAEMDIMDVESKDLDKQMKELKSVLVLQEEELGKFKRNAGQVELQLAEATRKVQELETDKIGLEQELRKLKTSSPKVSTPSDSDIYLKIMEDMRAMEAGESEVRESESVQEESESNGDSVDLKTLNDTLKSTVEDRDAKIRDLETELNGLSNERQDMQHKMEEQLRILAQQQEIVEGQAQKVEELELEISEQKENLEKMQKIIDDKESELSQHAASLVGKVLELQEQTQRLEQTELKLEHQVKLTREKSSEIKKRKKDSRVLCSKIANMKKKIDEKEAIIATLKAQLLKTPETETKEIQTDPEPEEPREGPQEDEESPPFCSVETQTDDISVTSDPTDDATVQDNQMSSCAQEEDPPQRTTSFRDAQSQTWNSEATCSTPLVSTDSNDATEQTDIIFTEEVRVDENGDQVVELAISNKHNSFVERIELLRRPHVEVHRDWRPLSAIENEKGVTNEVGAGSSNTNVPANQKTDTDKRSNNVNESTRLKNVSEMKYGTEVEEDDTIIFVVQGGRYFKRGGDIIEQPSAYTPSVVVENETDDRLGTGGSKSRSDKESKSGDHDEIFIDDEEVEIVEDHSSSGDDSNDNLESDTERQPTPTQYSSGDDSNRKRSAPDSEGNGSGGKVRKVRHDHEGEMSDEMPSLEANEEISQGVDAIENFDKPSKTTDGDPQEDDEKGSMVISQSKAEEAVKKVRPRRRNRSLLTKKKGSYKKRTQK